MTNKVLRTFEKQEFNNDVIVEEKDGEVVKELKCRSCSTNLKEISCL